MVSVNWIKTSIMRLTSYLWCLNIRIWKNWFSLNSAYILLVHKKQGVWKISYIIVKIRRYYEPCLFFCRSNAYKIKKTPLDFFFFFYFVFRKGKKCREILVILSHFSLSDFLLIKRNPNLKMTVFFLPWYFFKMFLRMK